MNDEKGLSLASIDDVTRLATIAVKSKLTKLGLVEEAAVILMTGRELGLAPMQSLRGIYVVDGKPTLSADMMVAVIRKSGQCETWRVVESTAERCTITTRRKGESADASRTWTRADADRAGVTHKDPWRKYPAAMLRHRCAADLARQEYPDVLLGLYDPDEMDAAPAQPAVVESVPTLESIGIERNIGTRPTLPAPAPARWAVELAECVTLTDVRGLYATHSRYAYEDAPARNRAMVDDVRAWLSERGVPGVTGAEVTAILSTLPEAALRSLSELWCDEEHPVCDRCVTAARAIHRAEWDEHSRRTAHTIVVRCYAHATGHTALNAAGADLCALRDTDDTAQPEAPADDVPADVLAKIAGKGSVREILNSVGAHAAEVLASPALAKAYAARLVTFAAADDPRDDAQRMADATAKVMAKARTKATDTQG